MQDPHKLVYGLDDLPPWPLTLLYGFQWVVIFLPIFVITTTVCSEALGLHGSGRVLLFQRLLITSGVIMILQTLWGHRYALLDGPASALLLSIIVLSPHGIAAIQGGLMVGGGFLVLLSLLGLMRYLESLFTDNVIGVILILVAITLLPHFAPLIIGVQRSMPQGDPLVFEISVLIIIVIALFNHWLSGFPKTISLFLGVLFGTLVMGALGRMDLSGVREASWFSLPHPLFAGPPRFSVSATMTFLIAYLAVIINAVGSTYGIGEVVGKEGMLGRVHRGIMVTGLGGLIAGALGGIGTVSYAVSPGVVLVTRVGSRFTITACGALLLFLAFFQKILSVLTSIPASVVVAAMIAGMAAQVGVGISVLTRSGTGLTGRDYLVIGIPMLMGGLVSVLPAAFFEAFPITVHALLKNGLVVGVVLVLALEHLLLPRHASPLSETRPKRCV
jgi:uracil permease